MFNSIAFTQQLIVCYKHTKYKHALTIHVVENEQLQIIKRNSSTNMLLLRSMTP